MNKPKRTRRSAGKIEPRCLVYCCERLGEPMTVGQLRALLRGIPESTSFWFRNQPSQALYALWQDGNLSVVFQ